MKKTAITLALRVTLSLIAMLALTFSAGRISAAGNTEHYGAYASVSPDSGTCGNDWATDTFDKYFKVTTSPNSDGTYTVVQDFKNGSFVTQAGASPGGCETNPGGVVSAGITGRMHGSFTIIVSNGTFSPAGECGPGACTTANFIATHFGTLATYDVPTYSFHYNAGNNGQWKNASLDRGGNHGDITGTP